MCHHLRAGMVDNLRLHSSLVLLGTREQLFDGVDSLALGSTGARATTPSTHLDYGITR